MAHDRPQGTFGALPSCALLHWRALHIGPDDQRASKVAVGIVNNEGQAVAELLRCFSETSDVRFDPVINRQIVEFNEAHAVRTVAGVERIIGCPHEEGVDYPQGGVCPACPYWAHRDRWTGETIH